MIIVSIPHTGSRFLRERLGIEEIIHTELSWRELVNKTAGLGDLVSPLKPPMAVLKSAVRRTPPELAFDQAGWIHNWYMMHALSMIRTINFIDLLAQDDPRITDWSPVGHNDGGNRPMYDDRPMPDMDLGRIYELPFVKRRYG